MINFFNLILSRCQTARLFVKKRLSWHFVLIVHYNHSGSGMTQLLFYGFGEARVVFLPSSENNFQC